MINRKFNESVHEVMSSGWTGIVRVFDDGFPVGTMLFWRGRLAWVTARFVQEDFASVLRSAGHIDDELVEEIRRNYQTFGKLRQLARRLEKSETLSLSELRNHFLHHARAVMASMVTRPRLTISMMKQPLHADEELTFGWNELFAEDLTTGEIALRPPEDTSSHSPGGCRKSGFSDSLAGEELSRSLWSGSMKPGCRVIAVTNMKGGSGKTTVALNLAVALAERGKRVTLVDTDPLDGIAAMLGTSGSQTVGLWDVLCGDVSVKEALRDTKLKGLALLSVGRLKLARVSEFEHALEHGGLRNLRAQLDFPDSLILLDTAPGVSKTLQAVIAAADDLLVPMPVASWSESVLYATGRLLERVQEQKTGNPRLLGILATMFDPRDDRPLHEIRCSWSAHGRVLKTVIPLSTAIAHAADKGLPLSSLGNVEADATRAFGALAEECIGLFALGNE